MQQDSLLKSLTKDPWQKDWWLFLFAKLIIAIFLPFFSDEAYYWMWSHNLKLSYFDHPPLISWLFYLGRPLENFLYAARIPTVFIGHMTIWIWCAWIAKNYEASDKRKLFWLLNLHTLIGVGSLVANPDVPFLFFWSLAVLFYLRSIENLNSIIWPTALGIALGLGFSSKYLIALFAPIAFIHLVVTGKWKSLKWQHLIIPVALGGLFSGTVWFWNYLNDWQSFKFQVEHGLGKTWRPQWTGDFILGTSLLLFPPFVYLFIKNKLFRNFKDFQVLLFLLLISFFIYTTTGGDTELNWPLALYPSFFFSVVPILKSKTAYRSFLAFFGVLGTVLLITSVINPKKALHPRLVEGGLYKRLFVQSQGYRPLFTSTYQSASYFWFLAKEPFYKLKYASRLDEYDFMKSSDPDTSTFYFLKEQYQTIPHQHLERYNFEKVADLESHFEIYKATQK